MTDPAVDDGRHLRVAVVGLGDISALHLEAISLDAQATVVAVCDIDGDLAKAVAMQLGCRAYADLAHLLDTEPLDVVHLCTPHHLHAGMAVECLERNVNVLLEKPLATSVTDGLAVTSAAQASAAQVGVCFQNRYNATSVALRSLLDGGSMGEILGGRAAVTWFRDAAYYRRPPWRGTWVQGGGGVLMNQAIHTLDLLQWFLGPPYEVHGHADRLWLTGTIEVEDTASIRMAHPGGAVSVFYATNGYVDNAPVQVELVGRNATARLDTDLTVTYGDGRQIVTQATELGTGVKAYWGAAHEVLIADFHRHVRSGRPFWIDAAAAMRTLEIITGVYANSPGLRQDDAAQRVSIARGEHTPSLGGREDQR